MFWREIIWWGLMAACTAPIWGTLIWFVNELYIRPLLIPKAEIERLAHEIMRRNPNDPIDAAFTEEQNAWYRSDTFEQGKWRRIRKEVGKRLR
jgi:hypothetical protein